VVARRSRKGRWWWTGGGHGGEGVGIDKVGMETLTCGVHSDEISSFKEAVGSSEVLNGANKCHNSRAQ
jgi:hypothetical protein